VLLLLLLDVLSCSLETLPAQFPEWDQQDYDSFKHKWAKLSQLTQQLPS
jgi:hypothetical protein